MEEEDFERFESRRNSLLPIDDYERIIETVLSLILSRLTDSTHMAQYSSETPDVQRTHTRAINRVCQSQSMHRLEKSYRQLNGTYCFSAYGKCVEMAILSNI